MKPKLKPPVSVGRLIFSHIILWPFIHLILGLFTAGAWLLIGLPLQVLDLWNSCNKRSKFADARHEEMLDAFRQGRK